MDDFIPYFYLNVLIRRGSFKQCSGAQEEGHPINIQPTEPDSSMLGASGGGCKEGIWCQGSNSGPCIGKANVLTLELFPQSFIPF